MIRSPTVQALDILALVAAGAGAGAMNALAGGGTILTFPTLLLLGHPAVEANATSTVALLPGAAASMAGYRREVATHRAWLKTLLVPSLIGGSAGSLLLLATPDEIFARLAPWLLLFATSLFLFQTLRSRGRAGSSGPPPLPASPWGAWLGQLGVALYGGYFGAGIGILMLVILGALGLSDIHAMNGLKNFFGICINGVAAAIFLLGGAVDYTAAAWTLVGAVVGGYFGARFGRYIGQVRARVAVILIGLFLAGVLFYQQTG
ncbi:MAG: sulfite exporter TauE/SafE family protein [Acidobacteria bacterium]|nr:sulfite exporter TauE/SafE family protein [Acidobacteriota bacterium]MCB9378142.1 sulfite exporter TauE/SafE family protein [Holophagales bacterium]